MLTFLFFGVINPQTKRFNSPQFLWFLMQKLEELKELFLGQRLTSGRRRRLLLNGLNIFQIKRWLARHTRAPILKNLYII